MSRKVETIKRESMVGKLFLVGALLGSILECLDSPRVSYSMYVGTNLATVGTGLFLSSKLVEQVK